MSKQFTFLVFGATGGTGRHFVEQALGDGHMVRALVRNPSKLQTTHVKLDITQGSITETDKIDFDRLVSGVDYVVMMVGEKEVQQTTKICTNFMKQLVPSMRRHGVRRILYQAGGLSRPYGGSLGMVLWAIRHTVARGYLGQHLDNEAVMEYFAVEANDMEWMVHRAGIYGDGPSKGDLQRSDSKMSIGTHMDCARFNYRTIMDDAAVHTSHCSHYEKC